MQYTFLGVGMKILKVLIQKIIKNGDKRAIKCFGNLANEGGYVFAEYSKQHDKVKIGKVKPNSAVIFFETKWSQDCHDPKRRKGDKAVLKTLQMENVKILSKSDATVFLATRPRMGTITEWKSIKKYLEYAVEGKSFDENWDFLLPAQQEAICAEYLRKPDIEECPKLRFLLLPVGRNLPDLDIYGVAEDGKLIFAQVTHADIDSKDYREKLEKLKNYRDGHLIIFCNCDKVKEKDGVLNIPTKKVFKWLKKNKAYYKMVFATPTLKRVS